MVVRHPLSRLLSAWRHVFDRAGDARPKFGLVKSYSWPEFVDRVLTNPDDPDWQEAVKNAGDHWEPFWRVSPITSTISLPFPNRSKSILNSNRSFIIIYHVYCLL